MLIWWLVDSIINASDPYEEPGAWWMLHTTSLFMVFTQVRRLSLLHQTIMSFHKFDFFCIPVVDDSNFY